MARVDYNAANEFQVSLEYEVTSRLRAFSRVMDQEHVLQRARAIVRNYMDTAVTDPVLMRYPPRITVLLELKTQKLGVRIRPGIPSHVDPVEVANFDIEKARRLQTCNRCMGAGEVLCWGEVTNIKLCPNCKGAGVVLPRNQYK
jgi:hypothetical protein